MVLRSLDLNNLNKQLDNLLIFISNNKKSPSCLLVYEQLPEKITIGGEQFLIDINLYQNRIIIETDRKSNVIDLINLSASDSLIAVALKTEIEIVKSSNF